MLDIVSSHQHELTLSVETKGVDETQSRLTSPAAAGNPKTMAKESAIGDRQRDNRDDRDDEEDNRLHLPIVAERKTREPLHGYPGRFALRPARAAGCANRSASERTGLIAAALTDRLSDETNDKGIAVASQC